VPYITANGIRIHYERSGGAKPPVVLLHGFTDNGRCWPRVTAALKADYEVIALDARGHGLSSAPDTGYSVQDLATDAAEAIKALGLKRPAVIGHSMGGMTAAVLGAMYPALPRCLVLEDPPFRPGATTPAADAEADQNRRKLVAGFKTRTLDEIIAGFGQGEPRSREWKRLWDASEWEPWYQSKQQVSVNACQAVSGSMGDWESTVARIACPTLLVTGDPAKSSLVTAESAARAAALNPLLTVANFPNAGHNIRRESFDGFIAAVTSFLEGR
jgi:N-formylmaleamate deformylase